MAKRHPPKVKFQVVLEVLSGEKTPGQVAKAYGVHPNSVSAWKRAFLEKGPEVSLPRMGPSPSTSGGLPNWSG
jgi:transposase